MTAVYAGTGLHTGSPPGFQPSIWNLYAGINTNHGDITERLLPDYAPKAVANFTELAEGKREWTHPGTGQKSTAPLYDGTIFHRVISGFMIQGGDPVGDGTGGPGYQFDDEIYSDLVFDKPYLLAMANAGRRGGRGTNGSQFFITVAAATHLNGSHTIFGKIDGPPSQRVVDSIAQTPTGPGDRPLQDVVIRTITIHGS